MLGALHVPGRTRTRETWAAAVTRLGGFFLGCATAYLVIAALYFPTLQLSPASLDDHSQLQEVALQPLTQVFRHDRFGHMRPVKSVIFWAVSRAPEQLAALRCALLLVFIASAMLWQRLCTTLLKSRGWALFATLCWALNPTTLSTLCWLSTANLTIALLGVLAYLHLVDRAVTARSSRVAVLCGAGAFASLLVAVLSYETAIFAPVIAFVYGRTRAAPHRLTVSRPRVRVLAIASMLCILVLFGLHVSQTAPTIEYRFEQRPGWLLAFSAPRYLFENLRLWLWLPGRFGVLLTDDPAQHIWPSVFAWLALFAAIALLLHWRRRDPAISVPLIWCALFLAPLMNFIPLGNTPIAIHYLYLPGVGLALLLARAAQSVTLELRRRGRQRYAWLPALVLGIFLVLALPEQQRVLAAWADPRTLYLTTIHNYPDNIEARVNLIAVYLDAHDYARADALLLESLRIAPSNVGLVANRFQLLAALGKAEEALAWQDAHPVLNTPEYAVPRGMLLEHLGRHQDAAIAFQKAFNAAVLPGQRFAAGYHLAMALVRTEQLSEAEVLIDRLLAEFPGRPELLFSKRLLTRTR